MQQMWWPMLWLRDKGAGMGVHIPKVRGLLHAGEEETIPNAATCSIRKTPMRCESGAVAEVAALRRHPAVLRHDDARDHHLHGHGHERGGGQPGGGTALLEGDRDAAFPAMADAFGEAAGILDPIFFIFIAVVGFKASIGLFDAFARGQSDMTYYFMPGAKRFKMAQLYSMRICGA